MYFWDQVPCFRLLLPFIAGVTAAVVHPENAFCIALNLLLAGLFALIVLAFHLKYTYRYGYWFGILVQLFLLLAGYQVCLLNIPEFDRSHYTGFAGKASCSFVKAVEPYTELPGSYRVLLEVKGLYIRGSYKATCGRLLAYFDKDSRIKKLRRGDCLLLKAIFRPVQAPHNPGEFDYKRYLYFHHVYRTVQVKSGQYIFTGRKEENFFLSFADRMKEALLKKLQENHLDGEDMAVCAGLLLGDTGGIDRETYAAFANTGTLHILSVSGLHVGLVYLAFGFLFSFFPPSVLGNAVKAVLLIVLLWLYALLTGLSPPVLRSAMLFSFLAFAASFNRHAHAFNLLCASCFLLLLAEPFMITDVGFQLSYFAVLGILLLQPAFYAMYTPRSLLLKTAWSIITVSLAAQISTFPLTSYYFKQFPNYFLAANLLVIPLSGWIIYGGMLLFIFSPVKIIASFLGKLLLYLIQFLTAAVEVINGLPYAVTLNCSMTVKEVMLCYLLLLYSILFFSSKKITWLKQGLLCLILLLVMMNLKTYRELGMKKFFIYYIRNTTAIDFIYGKKNCLFLNAIGDKKELDLHIRPNWQQCGINKPLILDLRQAKNFRNDVLMQRADFIFFGNKRFLIVDKGFADLPAGFKADVDYIILTQNAPVSIRRLQRQFTFRKIILDASNSRKQTGAWLQECQRRSCDCYSVADSGAYAGDLGE